MKICSYAALLMVLLSFCSPAYSNNTIEKEVLSGLDEIYNLDFDRADARFKAMQSSYPQDIRGYFYESLLYFYKALPSREDEQFRKFLSLSSDVIMKADNILEKDDNNFDAMYYKGLSHSYRSLLMLSLNKNLLEAASDGNEGYRVLSDLVKRKPDYYDAYMGLGLYKIALGFVPDKFKWLMSLIGFEGDIRNGIEMLNTSMTKGKYTRIDSKVFLSIFSLNEREQNDNRALDLSRQLVADYPESSVFKVFHSSLLLQCGFTDESIRIAEEALKQNKKSFQNEIQKSASAILGTAYFRLNEFGKSAEFMESFFKYANKEDRYNVHMFTMAISYEMIGDRSKAVDNYKRVREDFINERDGELEKFFYRYSRERLKSPLRQFDRDLIFAMNFRESGKLKESIEKYETLMNNKDHLKSGTEDDKIRLFHNIALAYTYDKQTDKAIENFYKCLTIEPETETWLVPHSYFELGKIYFDLGRKEKSMEMFEKTYDYDDFDFESFLEMRIANFKNKN
jgi:tetratricopeptide (TPR) repeat protein